MSVRELDVAAVTAAVKDLCITANYDLPVDVYDALKAAEKTEESPVGREVLGAAGGERRHRRRATACRSARTPASR